MFYVIQNNVFREEGYDALTETLERLGLDWEVVKVLPFTEYFQVQTDRQDVFVFGSLKMVRLAKKFGWEPGVLMSETHDFQAYRHHYGRNLLNHDSYICHYGEDFPWTHEQHFIRPCADTKEFSGRVFEMHEWDEFCVQKAQDGHVPPLELSTLIQVASVKRIQKEFRFWVVNGRVVTGSQYKLGRRTVYSPVVDPGAQKFCQSMLDLFQLARAFVMDVCLVDDEWKIVECGCINCAGFYQADMQRLVMALEEEFQ